MDKAVKVVITQSNYIPWKGYFDTIACCDYFVIYDTVQYTKRDWRNRNIIKTAAGLQWLSIPVEVSGKFYQKINDVKIADPAWNKRHWAILEQTYKNAPAFAAVKEWIQELYLNCGYERLTDINEYFIKAFMEYLGIKTKVVRAEDFDVDGDKNSRLVNICKKLDATAYLSGPAAKSYLDMEAFASQHIQVEFCDYNGYRSYPQQGENFEHKVSIVDMLFNLGNETRHYLKYLY